MTERLVIRDREYLRRYVQGLFDFDDTEYEARHTCIDRLVSADFSGLVEGGTELPKEEAGSEFDERMWREASASEFSAHLGSMNESEVEWGTQHAIIDLMEALRRSLNASKPEPHASLIDSSVSPPQQTETPK